MPQDIATQASETRFGGVMYNHAEAVTRLKHILTNEVEAEYSISSDLERASSPSAGRGSSVHRLAHSADHERLCRDLSSRLWGCWFEHPQDILCDNPAIMCLKFFEETGDQAMLDEILILERAALDMPPPGHSDQATSLATLSASLNRCFQHTGHRYLLQQAAKFEQEALHLSPLTDVERGCLLERLASALMKCFHETGEVEPLQMAVQINREALDLRARNNVDRALFLVNLTYPLKGHIALTGNQVLLDEAISLERETMRFMPPDHATRASLCTSLASLLWRRFHATNHIALLDEAMALEQEAIDRCSVDLSDRALSCGRLIDSILRRYGRMRESATLAREATLRKATAVAQEAIHLAPIGHPYRAWLRTSLLQCLHQSLKMTRATSVLDQIIVLEQEALSQRPRGHSERVLSCQILAGLLLSRFLGTGNIADVHQANMLDREAIDLARTNHRYELLPLFHPERASSCANLAVLLIQQFDQVGDVKLLEKAIALEREAMGLRPPGHTARAMSCGNLAFSLMKLFDQVGEITLLDEAITLEREARGLRPPGHVDRTISCDNLAVYLKRRFDRTGELTLLDEAIELQREAMDLCPSDYPGRALLYNNLAVSLGKHFDRTGNITQLHESISLHREAIVLRIPGDPDRILSCVNLAISLRRLFESTKSLVLLDEVIALEREAVGLRPPGHPDRAWLCWSLASSICRNAEAHNLELGGIDDITSSEVRSLLEEAVDMYPSRHPELWRCFQGAAELECLVSDWEAVLDNLHRTFNCSTHSDINAVLQCTAELIEKVDIDALSLGQKQKLLNIYGDAIGSMSLAASSALNPSTQLQNIFQGKALGSSAVMLSIQVHDLSKGVWLLENARGLIWTQMMQIRDVQLDNVPTTLAQKLQVLLDSVTPAPYSTRGNLPPEITHHTPFARLGQVQDVIRQIRSQPGFTDFMRGLDSEALFEGAAGNIVVMLVPHRRACHALLIAPTKEPLKSIKLNIGEESLWNLTLAGLNSPRRGGHAETDRSDTQRGVQFLAKPTVAHDRLAKLWRAVVKPIIIQLGLCKTVGRARPRIHWCPTGAFTFVPIHAAGIYEGSSQECCSDFMVSSYTPTLSALVQAQRSKLTLTPDEVVLLAIAADDPDDSSMPRLPHVTRETEDIINIARDAGASCILDSSKAARSKLRVANLVHFACHGIQHATEPHRSQFCLSDGRLSVTDLMKMNLERAFCAFLSACETATGDPEHADEVVHLAATMLCVGFRSVVATMWAMTDVDGPLVSNHFYTKLFDSDQIDVDSVAYALDQAVTALRMSGAPPERWATFIHMGA